MIATIVALILQPQEVVLPPEANPPSAEALARVMKHDGADRVYTLGNDHWIRVTGPEVPSERLYGLYRVCPPNGLWESDEGALPLGVIRSSLWVESETARARRNYIVGGGRVVGIEVTLFGNLQAATALFERTTSDQLARWIPLAEGMIADRAARSLSNGTLCALLGSAVVKVEGQAGTVFGGGDTMMALASECLARSQWIDVQGLTTVPFGSGTIGVRYAGSIAYVPLSELRGIGASTTLERSLGFFGCVVSKAGRTVRVRHLDRTSVRGATQTLEVGPVLEFDRQLWLPLALVKREFETQG